MITTLVFAAGFIAGSVAVVLLSKNNKKTIQKLRTELHEIRDNAVTEFRNKTDGNPDT